MLQLLQVHQALGFDEVQVIGSVITCLVFRLEVESIFRRIVLVEVVQGE